MAAPPQKKAFPLRIDPALYAAIERAAAGDLRSVNAEVECLLREALARRGVKLADPVRAKRGRPPQNQTAQEDDDGE
ncbi:type II toxin-antitoxin system antitoxin [Sphingomonas immobilis]|uniref:Toxin-antitoxin system HicB family antitoxin n=1 Tax=Sphingomonas immobilis TaxID=3063997 RepID=A0ABT9A409_9SPHN|nr:toxin-antitoxin system HicB family antitoxin [Sphingomonas sp. CA1-15]MDO7843950.1 toxin-antitoxin system HicB family antitoxin [Sphingomonas sp. CA1-15]